MNFEKIKQLKTPCCVIDEDALLKNLEILSGVQKRTGCEILLAQKAYSAYSTYPTIAKYLAGVTSSSLFEARLGYEEMGTQVHIYAPAYRDDEFDEIVKYCDHIVFNTPAQYKKFKNRLNGTSCGLRVNPEYSEIETDIYNPCFTNSRMGTTLDNIDEEIMAELDGLHFHTMCEQNSDVLWRTVLKVEEKFGKYLHNMKWLNFGGGHHITRPDYDIELLEKSILYMKDKYNLHIYLEPGEAVALNAGYLVCSVMETMKNGMDLAIVDTSAACHMPDVLEMPYRPNIIGSGKSGEKPYTYRLGGPTCLAGDVIGDYSFDKPLECGDRLILCDMAIYSMVTLAP